MNPLGLSSAGASSLAFFSPSMAGSGLAPMGTGAQLSSSSTFAAAGLRMYVNEGPARGPFTAVPTSYFVDTYEMRDGTPDGPDRSGYGSFSIAGGGPGGVGGSGGGDDDKKGRGAGSKGPVPELPRVEIETSSGDPEQRTIHIHMPSGLSVGKIAGVNVVKNPSREGLLALFAAYIRDVLGGDAQKFHTGITNDKPFKNIVIHQGRKTVKQNLRTLIQHYGQTIGISVEKDVVVRIRQDVARMGAAAGPSAPDLPAARRAAADHSKMAGAARDAIRGLKTDAETLERVLSRIRERMAVIEGELKKLTEERDILARQVESQERLISAGRGTLDGLRKELATKTATIETLEGERDALTAQLEDQKGVLRRAKGAADRAQELSERTARAQEALASATERAEALEAAVADASEKLDEAIAGPLARLQDSLAAAAGIFGSDSPVVKNLREGVDLVRAALGMLKGVPPAAVIPDEAPPPAEPSPEPAVARPEPPEAEAAPAAKAPEPVGRALADEGRKAIKSAWGQRVSRDILPEFEKRYDGNFNAARECVADACGDVLNEYMKMVGGEGRGPTEIRRILHKAIISALASLCRDDAWQQGNNDLFRQIVQKHLIAFSAERLPRRYQIATATPALRQAAAQFDKVVMEAAEGPADERRASVLRAVDEFGMKLDGWKPEIEKTVEAGEGLDGLLREMSSFRQMLSDYRARIEAGQAYGEDELGRLMSMADEFVRRSCQAEKSAPLRAPAAAPEVAEEVGAAEAVEVAEAAEAALVPPQALDLDVIHDESVEEIEEVLVHAFPEKYAALIHSLGGEAQRQLHQLYLRAVYDAMRILALLLNFESKRSGVANAFLGSLGAISEHRSLSRNDVMGIVDALLKTEAYEARFGIIHKAIRIAGLIRFGEEITDISREFGSDGSGGGIVFNGWQRQNGHIVPTIQTQILDADAYSRPKRTVYEIKSMQDGFGDEDLALLGRIIARPSERIVAGGADASRIVRFLNQLRKLAAAVQQNRLERAELHITSPDGIDPDIVEFIQRTIPLVRIFVYPSMMASRDAAREIPDSDNFHWVHDEERGAQNRFRLVGGEPRPYEVLASGPRPARSAAAQPAVVPARPRAAPADRPVDIPLPPPPRPSAALAARDVEELGGLFDASSAAASILDEDIIPRGTRNKAAAQKTLMNARLVAVRDDLSRIIELSPRLRPLFKGLADRIKRVPTMIPEAQGDRKKYIDVVLALHREISALEGLSAALKQANDGLAVYSTRMAPGEGFPDAIRGQLQGAAEAIWSMGVDVGSMEDVSLQLELLAEEFGRLAAGKSAQPGLAPQDLFKELRKMQGVDNVSYAELLEDLEEKKFDVSEGVSGIDGYRRFLGKLDAGLLSLRGRIPGLSRRKEEAWLDEFAEVESLAIAAWAVNRALNDIVSDGRESGLRNWIMGRIVALSDAIPQVASGDVGAIIADQSLSENVEEALKAISREADDLRTRVEALNLQAGQVLIEGLRERDSLEWNHASRIVRAFVSGLDVDVIRRLVSDDVLTAESGSPVEAALAGEIGSLFTRWKSKNLDLWRAGQNGFRGPGDEPWRKISDSDAMQEASRLLRELDAKAQIHWNADHHQGFRNFHARDMLNRIREDVGSAQGEIASRLRGELEPLIGRVTAPGRKDKPFSVGVHKRALLDIIKIYLWITRRPSPPDRGERAADAPAHP